MKWNWGTKITIGAASFMLFISFMVYLTTTQHFDLVAEDYYDQELAFQDVIEKRTNMEKLSGPPIYLINANSITLQLPADFTGEKVEGELYLFRPSDERMDQHIPLNIDADLQQVISTEKWPTGSYKLKLNFKDSRTSYYQEDDLYIR